jgi:hypothetical protein
MDVTLGPGRGADVLDVTVTLAGAAPKKITIPLSSGAPASGGVEIRFPAGYPAGKLTDLLVTATRTRDGAVLGRATRQVELSPGCTHISVTLESVAADGGTGGVGDSGADGSGAGGADSGAGGSGAGVGGHAGAGGSGAGGSGGMGAGGAGTGGHGGVSGAGGNSGMGGAGAGGQTGAGGADGGTIVSFSENFEAGNFARWSPGPSPNMTYAITSPGANGTAHGFQITGGGTGYSGPNIIFPNLIQPTHVSFWFQFGTSSSPYGDSIFALTSDDGAIQQPFVVELSENSGVILQSGAAIFPLFQLIENRWYHFEFTIDWSSRLVTATIDGNAVTPYMSMMHLGAGTGVKRIDLFNNTNTTPSFWDEIEID